LPLRLTSRLLLLDLYLHLLSILHKKKSLTLTARQISTRTALSTLLIKTRQLFMIRTRTLLSTLTIKTYQSLNKSLAKEVNLQTTYILRTQTTPETRRHATILMFTKNKG
jgi:hypothetical protein